MGFRALRAARTPGISTFLYMHGPSLSGHWYPARRAAATADPGDSSVIEPFFVADLLPLLSPPNAQPSQGAPACIPTPKTLSILANEVIGSPQSLGNRNASFTPSLIHGFSYLNIEETSAPSSFVMPLCGSRQGRELAGDTGVALSVVAYGILRGNQVTRDDQAQLSRSNSA